MPSALDIQALVLDMDGVLWHDSQPIGDLPQIFASIRAKGLKFVLATNNAVKTIPAFQSKLVGMGVSVSPEEIINSAMAAAHLLHQRFPKGGAVYIVGEDGIRNALTRLGFYEAEENVLAVVAGLDRQFSFDKLYTATRLIRQGAPFYGTNPDRTFPTPQGLTPGAGSILAAIEAASETAPIIAGKPSPTLFNVALERLGVAPHQALAVGDRLETDILGGQRAGCKTALVLSGVTSRSAGENWSPQPDIIAADLAALVDML
jgi:4-nitrophenyl phosphatase